MLIAPESPLEAAHLDRLASYPPWWAHLPLGLRPSCDPLAIGYSRDLDFITLRAIVVPDDRLRVGDI